MASITPGLVTKTVETSGQANSMLFYPVLINTMGWIKKRSITKKDKKSD